MADHRIIPAPWKTEDERQLYMMAIDKINAQRFHTAKWAQIGDMHVPVPTYLQICQFSSVSDTKTLGRIIAHVAVLLNIQSVRIDSHSTVDLVSNVLPFITCLTELKCYAVNIADMRNYLCSFLKNSDSITSVQFGTYNYTCRDDICDLICSIENIPISNLSIDYPCSFATTHLLASYLSNHSFDILTLGHCAFDMLASLKKTGFYARKLVVPYYVYKLDGILPYIECLEFSSTAYVPPTDAFWRNTLGGLTATGWPNCDAWLVAEWMNTNTNLTALEFSQTTDIGAIEILREIARNKFITKLTATCKKTNIAGDYLQQMPTLLSKILHFNTTLTSLTVGYVPNVSECLKYTNENSKITHFQHAFGEQQPLNMSDMSDVAQYTNIINYCGAWCLANRSLQQNNRKLIDICRARYENII